MGGINDDSYLDRRTVQTLMDSEPIETSRLAWLAISSTNPLGSYRRLP